MLDAFPIRHYYIRIRDACSVKDNPVRAHLHRKESGFHNRTAALIAYDNAPFLDLHQSCKYFGSRAGLAIDKYNDLACVNVCGSHGLCCRDFRAFSTLDVRDLYVLIKKVTCKSFERLYVTSGIAA